jgi:hypothetical protein
MDPPTLEDVETMQAVDLEPLEPEEMARLESLVLPEDRTVEVDEGFFEYVGGSARGFLKAYSGRRDILLEFVDATGIDLDREVADSGLAADVFRYLQGFSVAGVEEAHVRLPVIEIHRPFVDGCTTTATLKEGRIRKRNIGITLLGATFSGSCSTETSCWIEHTATRECITITYPARILFKKWVYPHIPGIAPIYTVKDIQVDPRESAIKRGISGAHGCALLGSHDAPVRSDDPNYIMSKNLTDSPASDGTRVGIDKKYTKGKMVELKVGIKTEAHPDGIGSLSFSLETSVLVEYNLIYLLKPGFVYAFLGKRLKGRRRSAVVWCAAREQ